MTRGWVNSGLRQLIAAIVALGLLTVPVQCADVDHVHSIFETPGSAPSLAHLDHDTAAGSVHGGHGHRADMLELLLAMDTRIYVPAGTTEPPSDVPSGTGSEVNDVPSLPRAQQLLVSPMAGGLSALFVIAVIVLAATPGDVVRFPTVRRLTGWHGSILAPPPKPVLAALAR